MSQEMPAASRSLSKEVDSLLETPGRAQPADTVWISEFCSSDDEHVLQATRFSLACY